MALSAAAEGQRVERVALQPRLRRLEDNQHTDGAHNTRRGYDRAAVRWLEHARAASADYVFGTGTRHGWLLGGASRVWMSKHTHNVKNMMKMQPE